MRSADGAGAAHGRWTLRPNPYLRLSTIFLEPDQIASYLPHDLGSKAQAQGPATEFGTGLLAVSRHYVFEPIGRTDRRPTMAVIGYARTSTLHQDAGLEAQIRQLQALGCDKVFSEQVSSVADRDRLAAALEYVREGDTFVVTKLDRLARSVAHLVEI